MSDRLGLYAVSGALGIPVDALDELLDQAPITGPVGFGASLDGNTLIVHAPIAGGWLHLEQPRGGLLQVRTPGADGGVDGVPDLVPPGASEAALRWFSVARRAFGRARSWVMRGPDGELAGIRYEFANQRPETVLKLASQLSDDRAIGRKLAVIEESSGSSELTLAVELKELPEVRYWFVP